MRAYERREIDGIAIRRQAGACSVCADASRDIQKPHLAPLPSLPLNGCQNPRGCRCLYSSPDKDPRRHPPEVPALAAAKLDAPRRLRHAAQFGGNPKKGCKPEELAEYLESFPLRPIESPMSTQDGEVAYLLQPATRAQMYPTTGTERGCGALFPLEGEIRAWVKQPHRPVSLPKDALWHHEDGAFCLTNWRILFGRSGRAESILLADILELEYLSNGIACRVAGDGRRTAFLLRDPVLCGLYVAKAVRDIMVMPS